MLMEKKGSPLLLTLLLTSMLTLAFNIQPVKSDYVWSKTIYIRGDGSIYPSDAPISTDDYMTYTLTDNIVGAVSATNGSSAIIIERNNIVLDGVGYTIQGLNTPYSKGIYLSGKGGVTIRNLKITAFWYCFWLESSSSNIIEANEITRNGGIGILLYSFCSHNNISGNKITKNDYGVEITGFSNYNSISGNNITANNGYGVYLASASSNSIFGNNITANNGGGVYLAASSNSFSGNNIIANNGYGVCLYSSSKNSLGRNNITNNWYGIVLDSSSSNSFSGNNIIANNGYGVCLKSSSSDNSISGNNITANNWYGIVLNSSSNYNSISGNSIANNWYGVWLGESSSNIIYHNNFMYNTQQVYLPASSYRSIWDDNYPSGGNYWSNYKGVDEKSGPNQNQTGNDGICDTPYVLDKNNRDRYPLMGIFSSFNTPLGYHVDVVSNSTVEYFEYFESNSTIKMHVSGEEGLGFCRVSIPHVLMNVSSLFVIIDDGLTPVLYPNYTLYDNGTHRWIYFAYQHSMHKIDITPEFSSFLILPLFMIVALLAVIVYKKKHC
jgi:parallel beta-helix repeat protein